ncbi:hypothetical protein BOTBODRAFT_26057 [Botryobasidium botryosum FD-172 SS1]|uniref:Methyltransferase domain-containing protein n=1 Tax=Botryobasidium botryosum (strain FD-172 SS1) TaxID=930990 RepID=A0A067N185_BOTB1|nr:hypothetical protein BOTBODRAFT_26057 [Botryobasidium botryosum FD-172 SS1]
MAHYSSFGSEQKSEVYADTSDTEDVVEHDDNHSSTSASRSSALSHSSVATDVSDFDRVRSGSPNPSIYTMTSSIRSELLANVHGRLVNNHSDVYHLPADDEEIDRLDIQHFMLKALNNGSICYGPVDEVLKDVPGVYKAILDLGCGTGVWAVEMARQYPHCDVVGVDLAPVQSKDRPDNCRIEVDDINLGLEHFYGQFDLVHARLISSGIKDYHSLVDQISQIVRPGGLFIAIECEFIVYDEHKVYLPPHPLGHPQHAWFVHFFSHLSKAMRARLGNIDAAPLLGSWLADHHAFEEVETIEELVPTGPWFPPNTDEGHRMNHVAKLVQDDLITALASGRPLLLSNGMPSDEVDSLIDNTRRELADITRKLYIKLNIAWGRKGAAPIGTSVSV